MKDVILDLLRQNGDFVSGGLISRQLGVTRAAVWKAVKALQREGYAIEAVTRRGYRLAGLPDILSDAELEQVLREIRPTGLFGHVQFARSTGSTNQMARQAGGAGMNSGLFVAETQQSGRGRRGRSWHSDRQGLWFSLLLRPETAPTRLAKITLFTGLCVALALRELGVSAAIKWPNDLVSVKTGRKLAGILTETALEEDRLLFVIIGIGINVNARHFPPELAETAASLSMECDRDFRRIDVLAAVLRQFTARYPSFLAGDHWLDDYRRLCLTLGKDVFVLHADGSRLAGFAVGLDPLGELVVRDEAGNLQTVLSGEVSVRGQQPDAQAESE